MPTKSFAQLVQTHVANDPEFAEPLLREGIDAILAGDVETGNAMLCDYVLGRRKTPRTSS